MSSEPRPWLACAAALFVAAAVALLVLLRPIEDAMTVAAVTLGGQSRSSAADNPPACKHWARVSQLPGGCTAGLAPGTNSLDCCACGGCNYWGYKCKPCGSDILGAMKCLSPRHMLLRPAPGCGSALERPLTHGQQQRPSGDGGSTHGSSCALASAAIKNGTWLQPNATAASAEPGVPERLFRPAAVCAQRLLGAAEVPQCLWTAGFDRVLIAGDSTVRHFFSRMISLLRQQPLSFDAAPSLVHGHYSWQLWQPPGGSASGDPFVTDNMWFSPAANHVQGFHNHTILADGLQHLLNLSLPQPPGGSDSSSSSGSSDGSRALTMDFLAGPESAWQQKYVQQYIDSKRGDATWRNRTLMMLSLCIWEGQQVWPEGWLEFLADMRARVGQVVLMTCPTDRLGWPDKKGKQAVVAKRNQLLRQMVEESRGGAGKADGSNQSSEAVAAAAMAGSKGGAPLLLLDVDALTGRLPPNVLQAVAIAPIDYHYQCYPSSNSKFQSGAVQMSGGDGSLLPFYPAMRYDHIRMATDGKCDDPVNYASLQLLFSMIC